MALDKKPILDEMDSYRLNIDKSCKVIEKKREGFHHSLVRKLSQAQILIGISSMVLGVLIEIFGGLITCEMYCFQVYYSSVGAGIWCGIVFVGVGILGRFAAKKKSTCLIVAVMAVGASTSLFAAAQVSFSVAALVADRNKFKHFRNISVEEVVNVPRMYSGTTSYWSPDRPARPYQPPLTETVVKVYTREYAVTTIPVTVFSLNLFQAILGLVAFCLLITSSVVCSVATCCLSKPNYLRVKLFEAVSSSGGAMYSQPMQMAPQPYVMPGGQMYYVPQGYGGNTQATMQPMIMMPMNSQAPVQYQVVGQPYPGVSFPPPTNPQTATVNQESTPDPV